MKTETITVTDAARNFADCINRTHYQQTSFVLLKNGKPVAKIVPVAERRCTGRELAEVVRQNALTAEESLEWRNDLNAARKALRPPADKWE